MITIIGSIITITKGRGPIGPSNEHDNLHFVNNKKYLYELQAYVFDQMWEGHAILCKDKYCHLLFWWPERCPWVVAMVPLVLLAFLCSYFLCGSVTCVPPFPNRRVFSLLRNLSHLTLVSWPSILKKFTFWFSNS